MRPSRQAVVILAIAAAVSTTVMAATFVETFSTMPVGSCIPDGSSVGAWRFVYNGYGCNAFVTWDSNTMLVEQPAAAVYPDETHGGLVIGPTVAGDFTLQVSTTTTRQLRAGGVPNPWEVGWVLWHYTDDWHFYYFIPKPNGWELGKRDPSYPGGQRFLATGTSPAFPINAWYKIRVSQTGNTIQVFADDVAVTTVADAESPYFHGQIGLYTEDAEVYFDNVCLTTVVDTLPRGKEKNKRCPR